MRLRLQQETVTYAWFASEPENLIVFSGKPTRIEGL
jgi:phage terminase large subunit-like protein